MCSVPPRPQEASPPAAPNYATMTTYALERAREAALEALRPHLPADTPLRLELPPPEVEADLALICFPFARVLRRSPQAIAADLAATVEWPAGGSVARAEAASGYLNLHFDWDVFARSVIEDLVRLGERYGGAEDGKTVVIDFSAPNIAKPMHVGHLRSTAIGDAMRRIFGFLGWRTIGVNHLGDWGTQFGKVIYAFREWGNPEAMRTDPVGELLRLYVRFHEEEENDPELEGRGREWFRRLEAGDPEAQRLWREFRELTLVELRRIYELLGVEFDSWAGEAFFEDKMEPVVEEATAKGLAVESEGALVIPLEDAGIAVPLMLRKRDGTSTYATRDMAAATYRMREYRPDLILYVVAHQQELHFRQLFEALRRLGYGETRCVHADFGLVALPEGKMSTRRGRIIFLEDVIHEAIARARAKVAEPKPDRDPLSQEMQEEIAIKVGIGALKYADLSQTRTKNIAFDWDRMLSLDGDTAPYLQMAYVRTRSVLRIAEARLAVSPGASVDGALLSQPSERELLLQLALYPEVVREAGDTFYPHLIANHVYRISQTFSAFWRDVPVLRAESPELLEARLFLVRAVGDTIRGGLRLLGIECPEQM